MKERPIIFNAAMVRAILDGRKTQTRRPIKPQPYTIPWRDEYGNADEALFWRYDESREDWPYPRFCPLGLPGDRLWVRETWMEGHEAGNNGHGRPYYRASWGNTPSDLKWRPSIHMPRWASRIALEITDVRVERIQDITEAEAMAEGIEPPENGAFRDYGVAPEDNEGYHWRRTAVESYRTLWDSIYYPGIYKKPTPFKWDANPWVWAIEFRRVEA